MEAKLVVVGGKANRSEVKLKLPSMVGRGRDADLTVAHATVSRHHCLIYELEGALVVRDNGSLNGTVVDGQRVQEALLKPGQTLTVGPLTFRAEYEHNGHFPDLNGAPPSATAASPDEAEEALPAIDTSSESDEQTVQSPEAAAATFEPEEAADAGDSADDHGGEFGFLSEEPQAGPASDVNFNFLDESEKEEEAAVSVPAAEPAATISDEGHDTFRLADDPPASAANPEKKPEKKPAPSPKAAVQKKTAPAEPEDEFEINVSEAGASKGADKAGDAALDDFLNSLGLDN
ncbi:MAG: hypothetical protein B7Z73_04630 [Planctomycetia bacterium 21-64-5]|nr:MAG: hypothetical protein B7Z73_04630 [Planctomycetia bacterium 21-64-5]HQU43576.1 FHA domain-containing protein [Pirellulales bacterium]